MLRSISFTSRFFSSPAVKTPLHLKTISPFWNTFSRASLPSFCNQKQKRWFSSSIGPTSTTKHHKLYRNDAVVPEEIPPSVNEKDLSHVAELNELADRGNYVTIIRKFNLLDSLGLVKTPHCFKLFFLACFHRRDITSATTVWMDMLSRGITPNLHMCTSMILLYIKTDAIESGMELWRHMKTSGISPNLRAYRVIIFQLFAAHRHDLALQLFSEMKEDKIEPDSGIYNTILRIYKEKKDLASANQLYEELVQARPNELLDHTIYSGYIECLIACDQVNAALEFVTQLQTTGIYFPEIRQISHNLVAKMGANTIKKVDVNPMGPSSTSRVSPDRPKEKQGFYSIFEKNDKFKMRRLVGQGIISNLKK